MHVQEHVFTHIFVFVTGRKMNNGTKQPNIPIPSMAIRKGGAGGGGCGGHGGGGGCGHGSKYLCVCFCENRPKSYISLFFGQNRPEKCNTYFKHCFRKTSFGGTGQKMEGCMGEHHMAHPEPPVGQVLQVAKSGHLALQQIRYFQSTQASMLLIRKLPFA